MAFASCREDQPAPATAKPAAPAVSQPKRDEGERNNLLNLANGGGVVSRTGEMTLDNSALRAIDGDPESSWVSPPADPRQSIVFYLSSLTRIDSIGVRTPPGSSFTIGRMTIDGSRDGTTFTALASPRFKGGDMQLVPVTPAEATSIRVTIEEAGGYATLQSVQVQGKPVSPPVPGRIADCWAINGLPAQFNSAGSVHGRIGNENPYLLRGGTDGPLYRFVWTRGAEWGFAAVTVSPDGQHFSGLWWHEEPVAYFFGGSWFGNRSKCTGTLKASEANAVEALMKRSKRYPLFDLHYDGNGLLIESESEGGLSAIVTILSTSPRIRLVSREYKGATAADNRRVATGRLDSLRAVLQKRGTDLSHIEFVAAGSDNPRQPLESELMRSLYGVIEMER